MSIIILTAAGQVDIISPHMNKQILTYVGIACVAVFSAFFISSCIMERENDSSIIALNRAMNSLGKRLSVIERNQKIIAREIKIINIKEKRSRRSIRRMGKEAGVNLASDAKLKKELQQVKEKNFLFARAVNKLILYSEKKSDELRSLKRKFYKLWRFSVGDKKPFGNAYPAVKRDQKKEGAPAAGAKPKESEKSRKNRKKLQEGMV